MVTFRRSPSGKAIDSEWHTARREARENAFSINEFGDIEITRFDLDTARITGRENPDTYTLDPAIDLFGTAGKDIRSLRRHD